MDDLFESVVALLKEGPKTFSYLYRQLGGDYSQEQFQDALAEISSIHPDGELWILNVIEE
jgi:hypothetical protein